MNRLATEIREWGADNVAVGVTDAHRTLTRLGDPQWRTGIASISKLLTGFTALVAWEEGTIDLDEPAGPDGSTVRHLLAHASGLDFDQPGPIAPVGRRRVYSNVGIELVAERIAASSGIEFETYLDEAVLTPLGMTSTALVGSPATGVHSTVDDLLRFGRELLAPTLVHPDTMAVATSVQFPGLGGVLPGVGRFEVNDWGLAFELRDDKCPHWTGRRNSSRTFGHFGGSGTFLWVDPVVRLCCVALTDRAFGGWALESWPRLSDAVLSGAL